MGDTQSAQRDGNEDTAANTESAKAIDGEEVSEDKPLGQISELNGKTDEHTSELRDHLDVEVLDGVCDTSAFASLKEEVKETLLENVVIDKTSPDIDEKALTEKEDRMNEINKGFRRFFNIGFKVTVSSDEQEEMASDVEGVGHRSLDEISETTKENANENSQENVGHNTAQGTADNESTTCPTVTDVTSEDIHKNAEDKNTATPEVDQEVSSAHEGTVPESEHGTFSPQTPAEEEEVVMSPIKMFFMTGVLSSLRRKKKEAEQDKERNGTNEKELVDMVREEHFEPSEDLVKDEFCPTDENTAAQEEQKRKERKERKKAKVIPVAPQATTATDAHEIVENLLAVDKTETPVSQEQVKVSSSPPARQLSRGDSDKVSTKQRGGKSSDGKLADSTDHLSDHLHLSTESAKCKEEESPVAPPEEVKGIWASFKRFITPKKYSKNSSLSNEEAVVSSAPEEAKPREGERMDISTEEGKQRKDSSVSCDALLCVSGSRRSRKTSDAEEQTPKTEGGDNRPDSESKHATESPLESSHETDENVASDGSNSGEEGSTWKSLKRLVTPKRKATEGESKEYISYETEIIEDESLFSIKKLLPGRKKRKPTVTPGHVPSNESERGEQSEEEDSEIPTVVPLSEFDTEGQAQKREVEDGLEQQLDRTSEAILPSDSMPVVPVEAEYNETALEEYTPTILASNKEATEQTELSKVQQLSDIPEEGLVEESLATPASLIDKAIRDDTLADDIIEFTSEAVTALEPVDITVDDETEMVSAVSHLTDSSKTSGHTTPVPAECAVKGTENFLHQVMESISAIPNEVSVSTSDQNIKRVAGSVSPQIMETPILNKLTILKAHHTSDATLICTNLTVETFDAIETFVIMAETSGPTIERVACTVSPQIIETPILNELTILKAHRTSDATLICTGLTAEAFDAVDKIVIMAETECVSEVNEAISTELISEDTTEEFDTAGISVDERHPEDVLLAQDCAKALQSNQALLQTNQTQETMQEAYVTKITGDERDVELHAVQMDVAEAEKEASKVFVEIERVCIEHSPCDVPRHIALQDDGKLPEVVKELDTLMAVHIAALNSEARADDVLEKQVMPEVDSENASTSITHEVEKETVTLSEQCLFEKEAATVDTEVPRQILVEDGGQIIEITNKLEELTSVYAACVNQDVMTQQAITEDNLKSNAEKVLPSFEGEVQKEVAIVTEQDLVEKELVVQKDGGITELTKELDTLTSVYVGSLNSEAGIIEQVISEDVLGSNTENASASTTVEDEKETVTLSEQSLLEKELVTVETDLNEEAKNASASITFGYEKETVTLSEQSLLEKELVNVETGLNEVFTNASASITVEDEKETVTLSEQSLLEKEMVTVETDLNEEPNNASTSTTVDDEKETVTLSEQSLLEKEMVTVEPDLNEVLTNASASITAEDEKETVTMSEQSLLEEMVTVESILSEVLTNASASITAEDEKETVTMSQPSLLEEMATAEGILSEVPQHIPVEDDGQVAELTKELEQVTSVNVASMHSEAGMVEVLEKPVISEDTSPDAENACALTAGEVENEAGVVTEPSLVEKELPTVAGDPSDVPQHSVVMEDCEVVEVTNEFEASTAVQVASLTSEASVVVVLENQVISEDILDGNTENASALITAEDEKETVTLSEQSLLEKEMVTAESFLSEVPRHIPVEDDGQVAELTKELEQVTSVNVASMHSEAGPVDISEKPVISENISPDSENASASITDEEEKETVTLSEQSLLEKELVNVETGLNEVPTNASASVTDEEEKETVTLSEQSLLEKELVNVETDLNEESNNASTSITAEDQKETVTMSEQSLLEKEMVTVETDLGEVLTNASASITAEDEKETVTMSQPSLLDEMVTAESILSEVPQHIPVQDDGQVAELTKELEQVTSVNVASMHSEAGMVEVLEKPVISEDTSPDAENACALITGEVENEAGVVTEPSLVEKELSTVAGDPSDVPQHSVVMEDCELVEVTNEFEASTAVQGASLTSEASVVEVLNQVISEDIPVEKAFDSMLDEVVNEVGIAIEQEFLTIEDDPNEVEQVTSVNVASMDYEAGTVEIPEKPLISENILPDAENASASITVEDEEETVTLSQQSLLEDTVKPIQQGEEEVDQDEKEDVDTQEGTEKSGNTTEESAGSCKENTEVENQEADDHDTTQHSHVEEEKGVEEMAGIDAIALEDPESMISTDEHHSQ